MKITTLNQRRTLKPRNNPYYVQLYKGVHLGYRKAPRTKTETWSARVRNGTGYKHRALGPVTAENDYRVAEEAAKQFAEDLQNNRCK